MLWNHLNDPEDETSFVVTLFVAVCRVSSAFSLFFLRAQCPLKLTFSSSLSNRKPKNNLQKWNNNTNRESWPHYTWTTIDHSNRCPFARACSSKTYMNVRPNRDHVRDTKFKKSKSKPINKWHAPFVPVLLSIFQIKFPETGWTRERVTRD